MAGLAVAASLSAAGSAGATITPVTHDNAGAVTALQAATGPGFTGGKTAFFIPTAPDGNPVGIGNAASNLPGFPRDGTTFLVLSTGDATRADQPDQPGPFPSVDDGGGLVRDRGDSAVDVTVLQIPFTNPIAPTGAPLATCLSFDVRFLSEEYPSHLGGAFNDAFIAELTTSSWTTVGSTISAPDNFASSPFGQPLTINSGGPAAMSPAEAAGTPYGAGTSLLHAQILVGAAAGQRLLFLSLFDHGDRASDSAALVDNLRLTTPPGACANGLTSLGPSVAITGPTVGATVDNQTPTLTGTASGPGNVTVRIYQGSLPAGTPVQTLPAARSGDSWSVVAGALAPGLYTAQATQTSAPGINGVSAPTTFTVVQPPPQAQGGSSQQQLPGDRDGDGIPDDQDTSDGSLPPIPGKTFDARVVSGEVFIKYAPGTGPRAATKPPKGFVPLKGAANVPMGSQLDTSSGRVALTSAADTGGAKTQTADFYDGIFQVKQVVPKKKPKKPAALITDLVMKGEPSRSECAPLKGAASVAAAKKKKRGAKSVLGSLWGNGKGKFRTNGKYSSATVRGTIWLTQDRCDGTLTTVKRGTVSVRDFKLKKTVSVKAGHSYLARAQRASSKAKRRTN
jgi:hypothetical protein